MNFLLFRNIAINEFLTFIFDITKHFNHCDKHSDKMPIILMKANCSVSLNKNTRTLTLISLN